MSIFPSTIGPSLDPDILSLLQPWSCQKLASTQLILLQFFKEDGKYILLLRTPRKWPHTEGFATLLPLAISAPHPWDLKLATPRRAAWHYSTWENHIFFQKWATAFLGCLGLTPPTTSKPYFWGPMTKISLTGQSFLLLPESWITHAW